MAMGRGRGQGKTNGVDLLDAAGAGARTRRPRRRRRLWWKWRCGSGGAAVHAQGCSVTPLLSSLSSAPRVDGCVFVSVLRLTSRRRPDIFPVSSAFPPFSRFSPDAYDIFSVSPRPFSRPVRTIRCKVFPGIGCGFSNRYSSYDPLKSVFSLRVMEKCCSR